MAIKGADRLSLVEDYYFVKKLEEIRELNEQGKKVINLGIGSPDMAPSQETVQALVHTASLPNSHGYQNYKGIPEFRKKVAEFYQKIYAVQLDPNTEVLPLLGSKEGILHLSMAFLNPGDGALIPDPGYPTYTSLTKLTGGKVVTYDLNESTGWYPDLVQIEKNGLEGVKLMWLNYPHMPTGTRADKVKLQKIVDFAKANHILLCHDNPYSQVLNEERPLSILSLQGAKEVAVELNSFSKSFNMAGWRVGMMVGKAEFLNAALRIKSNIDSGMFLGVQQAAIAALDNSEEWHLKRNQEYADRRQYVYQILDYLNASYTKEQTGLFIWAKVPDHITAVDKLIDNLLYKANVFITPGSIFGKNGTRYIRISLCASQASFMEAYERIKKVPVADLFS
ncbi:MAG TPA: aminotransferase class I/II-fold pyridoxal phosphate-dependent enzyme [Cytophagales bacterium]|nr:aminotransferase class I/II-fold pyridoxal phosphate-dependent enzyme [Cytophagales bacterium]